MFPNIVSALREEEEVAQKEGEKVEQLEQALFELRDKIGAGRHVPPGVHVLSLSANPVQDWVDLRQAALDRPKEEKAALLQRLSALETSGAHSAASSSDAPHTSSIGGPGQTVERVPRASWAAGFQETQLEEELRQKEKRMIRLRQAFTASTAAFREALSAILGIKVAFYDNGQIRVTSQYDLGAAFVSQPGSGTLARTAVWEWLGCSWLRREREGHKSCHS
jgi:mitotic spindle assembly checkpoint protein MAD1